MSVRSHQCTLSTVLDDKINKSYSGINILGLLDTCLIFTGEYQGGHAALDIPDHSLALNCLVCFVSANVLCKVGWNSEVV